MAATKMSNSSSPHFLVAVVVVLVPGMVEVRSGLAGLVCTGEETMEWQRQVIAPEWSSESK